MIEYLGSVFPGDSQIYLVIAAAILAVTILVQFLLHESQYIWLDTLFWTIPTACLAMMWLDLSFSNLSYEGLDVDVFFLLSLLYVLPLVPTTSLWVFGLLYRAVAIMAIMGLLYSNPEIFGEQIVSISYVLFGSYLLCICKGLLFTIDEDTLPFPFPWYKHVPSFRQSDDCKVL